MPLQVVVEAGGLVDGEATPGDEAAEHVRDHLLPTQGQGGGDLVGLILVDDGEAGLDEVTGGQGYQIRIEGRIQALVPHLGEEALRQFPREVLGEIAEPSLPARLFEAALAAPLRALRDRAFALARRIVRVDRG